MTKQLNHAEAIDLALAMTAECARQTTTRSLVIKGPSLAWHGLRPPRVSADVDVLLPTPDVEPFIAQLHEWGWYSRPGRFDGHPFPHHSVTLIHERWPCDVDVHRRFPGFLGSPDAVFETLWERRLQMPIAGVTVNIPDKSSSILIMALHSIRSTENNPRHAEELRRVLQLGATLPQQSRDDLALVAAQTGANHALDGALSELGVSRPPADNSVDSEELHRWRNRMLGRQPNARVWFTYMLQAPLHRWPGRAREALWPSEAAFRTLQPVPIPPGRAALNAARRRRLMRGLFGLPSALLAATGLRKAGVLNTVQRPRRDSPSKSDSGRAGSAN